MNMQPKRHTSNFFIHKEIRISENVRSKGKDTLCGHWNML